MKPYQLSLGGFIVSTLLLLIDSACNFLVLWETDRPSMWFLLASNLLAMSMAVMLYVGPRPVTAEDIWRKTLEKNRRETVHKGVVHTTTMSPDLEEAYRGDFRRLHEEIKGLERQIQSLQRGLQKSRERHRKATTKVGTLMEALHAPTKG